jgi:hypothetical protein
MAVLGKTVRDVYDAMVTAYRTCKDKMQGAKDALEIYQRNRGVIEETKQTLVELDDLVDALRESLNVISEQRSRNQVKKTQIKTKGSIVPKLVPCGKNCKGCPHGPYLYKVSRVKGKLVWEYLGRANETDDPDPRQNSVTEEEERRPEETRTSQVPTSCR